MSTQGVLVSATRLPATLQWICPILRYNVCECPWEADWIGHTRLEATVSRRHVSFRRVGDVDGLEAPRLTRAAARLLARNLSFAGETLSVFVFLLNFGKHTEFGPASTSYSYGTITAAAVVAVHAQHSLEEVMPTASCLLFIR